MCDLAGIKHEGSSLFGCSPNAGEIPVECDISMKRAHLPKSLKTTLSHCDLACVSGTIASHVVVNIRVALAGLNMCIRRTFEVSFSLLSKLLKAYNLPRFSFPRGTSTEVLSPTNKTFEFKVGWDDHMLTGYQYSLFLRPVRSKGCNNCATSTSPNI